MINGPGLKAQELFTTSRDLNKLHLKLVNLQLGKRFKRRANIGSPVKAFLTAERPLVQHFSYTVDSPFTSPASIAARGNSVHIGPYNYPVLTQKLRLSNGKLPELKTSVLRKKLNVFFPASPSESEVPRLPRLSPFLS